MEEASFYSSIYWEIGYPALTAIVAFGASEWSKKRFRKNDTVNRKKEQCADIISQIVLNSRLHWSDSGKFLAHEIESLLSDLGVQLSELENIVGSNCFKKHDVTYHFIQLKQACAGREGFCKKKGRCLLKFNSKDIQQMDCLGTKLKSQIGAV